MVEQGVLQYGESYQEASGKIGESYREASPQEDNTWATSLTEVGDFRGGDLEGGETWGSQMDEVA